MADDPIRRKQMQAEQWGQNDKDKDFDLFIFFLSFCPHRSANNSPK
jgi:hypothetical protein